MIAANMGGSALRNSSSSLHAPPSDASGLVPRRITVGLPTYSRPELAERAARSVLAQTGVDVELLVSDDLHPGDNSADRIEALRPLAEGKTLRIIRQPERLGLVRNFDACLRAASGEFFLLLGDDDELFPGALEALLGAFLTPPAPLSMPEVGMAWCPCQIASADAEHFWNTVCGPATESPASMLQNLWGGNRGPRLSSILIRTADLRSVGGYEVRYGDLCDIGAWAKAALAYPAVVCVAQPLVRYTNHQKSATSQSAVAEWQRLAYVVHDDLMARAHALGNTAAERTIRKSRTKFLCGITLTILMQTLHQPGGLANAAREAIRSPRIMFSSTMLKRALRDGWKVFRLR